MQHFVTAFLIISLVIVINQGSGVTAQDDTVDELLAIESKNRAVTILSSPQYVTQPKPNNQTLVTSPPLQIEQRPPSKPPNIPDITAIQNQDDAFYAHFGQFHKVPQAGVYPKQPMKLHLSTNSIYKFPRVVPLPHHRTYYYKRPTHGQTSRPLNYAASTGKPAVIKSPKFSLPVQVINGIPSEFVKPPKHNTTTTTSTTTVPTTTTTKKILRTKRIWPKHVLNKLNTTVLNITLTKDNSTKPATNSTDEADRDVSESKYRVRFVNRDTRTGSTTVLPTVSTTRGYRPVTRRVKVKTTTTTTLAPINFTNLEHNEWVPILPSHYAKLKKAPLTPIQKRSDVFAENPDMTSSKQTMYLQSFGLVPMTTPTTDQTPVMARKKMIYVKSKQHLNPIFSGYSGKRGRAPAHHYGDLESSGSHGQVVTKIKHHHHHHHHRYVKTVEKPVKVPYKVEVPKPYPVTVEKKVEVPVEKIKVVEKPVPYPVTVEKKVPYPIGIKIPHPVPVKVVEKEYVPKPYPVVQQVPVVKHVEVKVPQAVPVPVEKQVPYPVEVKVPVPVDRPVPVPVHIEKRVPYPVPVRILVPQPYPVEKRVPYPVEVKVKEPVEVVKHVPIKVPYPQPYAVKVPHPVPITVEKKVPYPVRVEKKVPVPYEVIVPQRIEVEKKVPVYIPKPYPVEKKVPYPIKVPYPVKVPVRVKVPVKVPYEVPVYIHPAVQYYGDDHERETQTQYPNLFSASTTPDYTVTVHGNTGFTGFESRSDKSETTTTAAS